MLGCLFAGASDAYAMLREQQSEVLQLDDAFSVTLGAYAGTSLQITFSIAPGYYLYQSGFVVSVDSKQVSFETEGEPVELQDDYFGLTQVFFEQVGLRVRKTPGVRELGVEFQGCAKDRFCYPPSLRTFDLTGFSGGLLTPEELNTEAADQHRVF